MSQGFRRLNRSQKLYPLSYGRLVLESDGNQRFYPASGANLVPNREGVGLANCTMRRIRSQENLSGLEVVASLKSRQTALNTNTSHVILLSRE
jgi:hypothetical protein